MKKCAIIRSVKDHIMLHFKSELTANNDEKSHILHSKRWLFAFYKLIFRAIM